MMIPNSEGERMLLVRLVRKDERYGLNDCLVHDREDPLVEFYDLTYANRRGFGERGQFVSSYYASTLLASGGGIDLYGGEPAWQVSAEAMADVRAWVRGHLVRQ